MNRRPSSAETVVERRSIFHSSASPLPHAPAAARPACQWPARRRAPTGYRRLRRRWRDRPCSPPPSASRSPGREHRPTKRRSPHRPTSAAGAARPQPGRRGSGHASRASRPRPAGRRRAPPPRSTSGADRRGDGGGPQRTTRRAGRKSGRCSKEGSKGAEGLTAMAGGGEHTTPDGAILTPPCHPRSGQRAGPRAAAPRRRRGGEDLGGGDGRASRRTR